ncbi:hypothetical protein, variant [Aphanomyces invadans]|uniref:Uncharacterized protein n=1 Tax=Aphanomyces invadans TaxID=157072 RepID=A0A024TRX1_9STRA|nr:hypothetical protein, variant [Aphanomyces invadans]ETV96880.1 hypothetical protein, variant [Aphanomyces invadans]|eukprot:XP_008874656.1 hypothetical protein, variant [Aphanomyces invadans]
MAPTPHPLDVELTNALTFFFMVVLMVLFCRMVLMNQELQSTQLALAKNHVAFVPQLGPSLDLLQVMSMDHLQQFLRQQDQVSRVAMDTIAVPFDLVGQSVRYMAGSDSDTTSLSFDIQSTEQSIRVQVLWDVDAAACIASLSQSRSHGVAHASKRRRFPRPFSAWLRNVSLHRRRSSTTSESDLRPLQDAPSPPSAPSFVDLNLDDVTLPSLVHIDPCVVQRAASPSSATCLFHYTHASLPRPTSNAAAAVVVVRSGAPQIDLVVHAPSPFPPPTSRSISAAFFVLDLTATSCPIKQRFFACSSDAMIVAHVRRRL